MIFCKSIKTPIYYGSINKVKKQAHKATHTATNVSTYTHIIPPVHVSIPKIINNPPAFPKEKLLPEVPKLPNIIPKIPDVPKIKLPDVPKLPNLPELPKFKISSSDNSKHKNTNDIQEESPYDSNTVIIATVATVGVIGLIFFL